MGCVKREVYDLRRGLALPVIGSAFPYFRHKFIRDTGRLYA